jgi:hypothetical protein
MTIANSFSRSSSPLLSSLLALALGACASSGKDETATNAPIAPGTATVSASMSAPGSVSVPATTSAGPATSTTTETPPPASTPPSSPPAVSSSTPMIDPTAGPIEVPTMSSSAEPNVSADPSSSEPSETSSGGAEGMSGEDPPAAGGAAGSGTNEPPVTGGYNPDFKEFYGEDCVVGDPQEVDNTKLPDLFANIDGTRISKKSEWRCRRAELKAAVEKFIHGAKPGTPDSVTGEVTSSSINVNVDHGGKSISFSIPISLPSGADGPVPLMIGLGGVGGFGGDANLGDTVKAEGVATGNYSHNELASESSRSGLFTQIYGTTGASAQVAWAWGISRVIDVLVSEQEAGRNDIIDPTAVGITGCSRNGKGAFTIGAFDERIALGMPQESGTGGVSSFRIILEKTIGPNKNPPQPLVNGGGANNGAWNEAQGWFGTVLEPYLNNVKAIPADTHSLVAMYAPRGLLVLDNSRIGELGSVAENGATTAGAEVYKALGVEHNIGYHGGNPDDPHDHCAFYKTQVDAVQRAIRGHLTRTAEPDGKLEPQPVATADMTKYVDWETPTLTDD